MEDKDIQQFFSFHQDFLDKIQKSLKKVHEEEGESLSMEEILGETEDQLQEFRKQFEGKKKANTHMSQVIEAIEKNIAEWKPASTLTKLALEQARTNRNPGPGPNKNQTSLQ